MKAFTIIGAGQESPHNDGSDNGSDEDCILLPFLVTVFLFLGFVWPLLKVFGIVVIPHFSTLFIDCIIDVPLCTAMKYEPTQKWFIHVQHMKTLFPLKYPFSPSPFHTLSSLPSRECRSLHYPLGPSSSVELHQASPPSVPSLERRGDVEFPCPPCLAALTCSALSCCLCCPSLHNLHHLLCCFGTMPAATHYALLLCPAFCCLVVQA